MPLWKKSKYNRISQLVADHIHQPKRGGSLVVETGFPTSLVDLFDKNRDRLKKPPKKTRFDSPVPPLPPSSSQPLPPPASSTVASSRPPNSRIVAPSARDSASGYATPQRCSSGRVGNESVMVQREDGGRDEVVNANGVFVAILKMFLVVVLTLWTKKFVVGFTISAFLLLVIDFAGKHLFNKLPKPCAKAQKSLQSLVERVLCSVGIKRARFMIREDRVLTELDVKGRTFSSGLIDESLLVKDGIQNIQIEQHSANLNLVPPPRELPSVDCDIPLRNGGEDMMGKMEEVMEKDKAHTSEVLDHKGKKTHRRRIKSKIKKLVKKKFCGSKKKQLELNTQASSSGVENKVAMDGERDGLECDERSLLLLSSRWSVDQVDELSGADMDDCKVGDQVGTETKWNSGYLILILIVLVGLVGGRVLAFALTFSWCLLVKLAATLRRFI